MDAYQPVSQTTSRPITIVCDNSYTIVAKADRDMLLFDQVYGGVHERLRGWAA